MSETEFCRVLLSNNTYNDAILKLFLVYICIGKFFALISYCLKDNSLFCMKGVTTIHHDKMSKVNKSIYNIRNDWTHVCIQIL